MADGNGGPLSNLSGYLSEIDLQDDELDRLRSEYMNACKSPRSQIKEIKASAKEAGVNMRSFGLLLRSHRSDRRLNAAVAALEPDDQQAFDDMVEALGDFGSTGLGSAALARAKPKDDGALDSLSR